MKTIKHEIKLEKSVKIIFAILAVGVFLNVFQTPIAKKAFGISNAHAESSGNTRRVWILNWPQ